MANTCFLSLSFCFLIFINGCFSQTEQAVWRETPSSQQRRLRAKSECRIRSLNALEPTRRVKSEAGYLEFWDAQNEQFDCAGVAAVRHVIQPKGLLLPSFTNAPQLTYILRGTGVWGVLFPGCPETYQSSSQSRGDESQKFSDQHQKIREVRVGDVVALPTGVANWVYNDGDTPLIGVTVYDSSNDENQLDPNIRGFFLAGNQQAQSTGGQQQEGWLGWGNNVFTGLDVQLLANAFGVGTETARKLQSQNDRRGPIVRVQDELRFLSPRSQQGQEEEERRQAGSVDGLEETFCSLRLRQNLNDPSRADVYNPRGGRITSLNSQKLPILRFIQLSAERGVLHKNSLMAPHWNMNAHSIIYVTRGNGRLQVVGNLGETVFDGQLRQDQILIVPQNFAVVKKAGSEGFEWISFKTNDNAMISPLAGRLSAIRNMPEEVLMNSYDISGEDARNLKYSRDELTVFGPGFRSQGQGSA